jgi:uncharacterized protein
MTSPGANAVPSRGLARRARSAPVRDAAVFAALSVALAGSAAAAAPILGPGLQFVVALGPAVIALVMASRARSARALLASLVRRPADPRWFLALLMPIGLSLAVVPIAAILGHPTAGLFGKLTPVAAILPLVVVLPAAAEELAWRGFALPRLLSRTSPLMAALLIAVPWAAMHLPLYLSGQPYAGTSVWPSLLSVLALSILLTWLYVRSGGSVLLTTLFHTAFNAATPLTWAIDSDVAWAIRPVLLAIVAVAVVALGGLRRADPGQAR